MNGRVAIWAYLALLSFVEFTICGLGLAMGRRRLAAHHLWSALYGGRTDHAGGRRSPAFLVESVRPRQGRPDGRRRQFTMGRHDPGGDPVVRDLLTFVADWMGLLDFDNTWLAGLVVLLGSVPLLWVTRIVRHPALVYLGLVQFVAGTLDLSSCVVGWNNATMLAGWLAVTAALLGLASGRRARRRGDSSFRSSTLSPASRWSLH